MASQASTSTGGGTPAVLTNVSRSVIGWGILFVALIALADIEATAEIAAAFAWLIFVSVLLLYGPTAFAALSTLTQGKAA